jgi:hypothetical protein
MLSLPRRLLLAGTPGDPFLFTCIPDLHKINISNLRTGVRNESCYTDILRQVLRDTRNEKYLESIPSIPLYLELGASSTTMVSLISLGLSRTTAGIIADKAANPGMSQQQAEDWLMKQNLEGLGVPGICIREVEKLWSKK